MAYTTIKKPSDYFNTKLYTGNGSTGNAQTGIGFQPDMTWLKNRDTTNDHELFDSVRTATKTLYPNRVDVEYTNASGSLTSFDSDGFTVGNGDGANKSGSGIASWNWLANGAGVSNTDGSITSTVSANTTSGFSIVSYSGNSTTGATVGHGLSTAPKMIIIKSLGVENMWEVYHESLGNTKGIYLNGTDASFTTSARWNNTSPTSSVWTMGNTTAVNGNGINYIAYCFADVQGFSKFSSYVGNGNANGTFCYTGMKPAFVIAKDASAVNNWRLFDNKRPEFNLTDKLLFPSLSDAEAVNVSGGGAIDILSNGFKIRSSANGLNASGSTYIYMAFAEEPLVGDNPATAR